MSDTSAWGPLGRLIGEWEGDGGLDVSFHNASGRVAETKFRERVTLAPFGPVANGTQCLYGLDYRMSAWRVGTRGELGAGAVVPRPGSTPASRRRRGWNRAACVA